MPQRIAVIGAVGQKDLALDKRIEHVVCAAPVMGLAFGQFQSKRQARGIDKRMDLCRQAAPRAAHATGSIVFFLALAAC